MIREDIMSIVFRRATLRSASIVLVLTCLAGCATGTDPRDPFEPFNRGVYQFNENLDKYLLKPVAEGYRQVLPSPVRTGVSNFFSNLNDIVVLVNNTLQGKFTLALDDFSRVLINSSIGLLGLIDVASDAGIAKHDEDFGQTLGVWGMRDGPFIMLPFFGPSNGRDVVGRVGDLFTNVLFYVNPTGVQYGLYGTRVVSTRTELLDASNIFDTAALDRYQFLRDAYLQRRRNLIFDGAPPPEKDDDAPSKTPQKGAAGPTVPSAALIAGIERASAAKAEITESQRAPSAPEATAALPQAPREEPQVSTESAMPLSSAAAELDCEAQSASEQTRTSAPTTQSTGSTASGLVRFWRYVQPTSVPRQTLNGS
jgi:phospholipid-binding lipoprotein MlaA